MEKAKGIGSFHRRKGTDVYKKKLFIKFTVYIDIFDRMYSGT